MIKSFQEMLTCSQHTVQGFYLNKIQISSLLNLAVNIEQLLLDYQEMYVISLHILQY